MRAHPFKWKSRISCTAAVLAALHFHPAIAGAAEESGVAILLIDTDRVVGRVEEAINGQFLEHLEAPSMEEPDRIKPIETTQAYSRLGD